MSRSFSSSSSTKRSFNNASRINQSSLAVDNSEKFKKTGIGSNLSLNTGNLSIGDDDPGNAKLLVTGDSHIMGKLGIGTKTPTSKLHVIGDINYTGDIYKNGVVVDIPWEKNTTTNNIYYSTGNVGIGTETPSRKLEVIGDISFSGNLYQGNSLFTSGGGGALLTIQDEGVSLDTSGTTLNFTGSGVTASGTGETKIINITDTTIDKDTDVSLNNLYVHGDLSLNNGSIFSNGDISTNGTLNVGENIIAYNNVDIKNNLDISGNVDVYGNFTIHNSNLNYVNINSTNISVSDNIIDIGYSDISNTYDKGLIFNSIKDNSNQALLWKYDQSSFVLANVGDISGLSPPYNVSSINNYSNLRLGKVIGEEDASFNKNVIIDGSMGISTTNPLEKLHVVGDLFVDGNNIWLKGRENYNENLRLYHSDSNAYIDWSGGNFYIRNNNSTKVLIKDNGNIGIGTTNPTAKLEVMGDISNSNNAYINGNIYSEGDLSLNSGNLFVSGDISSNSKIKSTSLDSSNVNISDLTVFDSLVLGSNNVGNKFTQIDTSINLLDTSASNLISRVNILDTSFVLLDTSASNLTTSINTLDSSVNLLDTSASNLTTRVNILDYSSNLLTSLVNTLDISFVLLDTSASNLTTRVNTLDTSFVLLDTSASNLTTRVNTLDNSFVLLDTSASNLTSRVNTLDTSFILLDTSASNLTINKQDLVTKDTDLSVNNLYISNDVSLNSGNLFVSGDISCNNNIIGGNELLISPNNVTSHFLGKAYIGSGAKNIESVEGHACFGHIDMSGGINNNLDLSAAYILGLRQHSNGRTIIQGGHDGNSYKDIRFNTSNISRLSVSNAGKVKIGSNHNSVTAELDVDGDISCNGILTVPDISCNDNLFVGNKVGVGTQTPTKPLEVIGDISFSGNLYQGNSLFTSGGSGPSLTIQDEGVSLDTSAVILNFVGSGVSASGTQSTKTITINSSGGGGGSTSIDKDTDVSLNNLYVHGDVSLNTGSIFSSGDISTNSDLLFSGNLVKNGSNIVLDEITLDSLDFTDTNLVNSSGTNVEVELAGSVSDFTINGNLYVPTGDISTNNTLYTNEIRILDGIMQGYSNGVDVSAGFWMRRELNIGADGVLKISSEITTGGEREGVSLQTYIDNNHDNGPNAGFNNSANRHTLALQPLHGNVGIGTLTPNRKLEIIGDISFSGTLYNGNEEFSSGGGGEQPVFLARGTSTANISNTHANLTWDAVITNSNYYSLNSNEITFNSVGTYLIDISVRTINNNRSELFIKMYINGVQSTNDIMSDYVSRDTDQETGGCSLHTALNVTNTTTVLSFQAFTNADNTCTLGMSSNGQNTGNALPVPGTNLRIHKVF